MARVTSCGRMTLVEGKANSRAIARWAGAGRPDRAQLGHSGRPDESGPGQGIRVLVAGVPSRVARHPEVSAVGADRSEAWLARSVA